MSVFGCACAETLKSQGQGGLSGIGPSLSFKLGCVVPSSAPDLGKPKVADDPTRSVAILAQARTQCASE